MQLRKDQKSSFPLFVNGSIKVRGYFFDDEGDFYHSERLLDKFPVGLTFSELVSVVSSLNGCFSVYYESPEFIFASVDRLRSFPIFYTAESDSVILSDNILDLSQYNEIDECSKEEFLRVGFTIGNATLFKDVKQLNAGQFLYFNKPSKQLLIETYYQHIHKGDCKKDRRILLNELDSVVTNWAKRLIASADGRTIFAGLSGGYDSRSIVCALKREGYENVVCFSYGNENSYEHKVAKQVADTLGYPIHIVRYNDRTWKEAIESEEFQKYCIRGLSDSSNPCIQEFPAIYQLHNSGAIPQNSIIVPGYAADVLGGSYVPKELNSRKTKNMIKAGVSDFVYYNIFGHYRAPLSPEVERAMLARIEANLCEKRSKDIYSYISTFELWLTENHLAKFINYTAKTYETFGYEWRLPLWDNELIDWWYTIPAELRANSTLYHEYLFSFLFEPLSVGFKKAEPVTPPLIKRLIPRQTKLLLINGAKRLGLDIGSKKKDEGNFHIASQYILARTAFNWDEKDFQGVNGLVGAFCLEQLQLDDLQKRSEN
ncbi:asparagine synthase-related protein [Pseudoalteromonas phenolica]|uniref:asparagine synthase-related protein n=1 Tax=Pseudoalteromonas phenolica TaxID=161398 RepID=UPI00384CCDA2